MAPVILDESLTDTALGASYTLLPLLMFLLHAACEWLKDRLGLHVMRRKAVRHLQALDDTGAREPRGSASQSGEPPAVSGTFPAPPGGP